LTLFAGVIFLLIVDRGNFFGAFDGMFEAVAARAGIFALVDVALGLSFLVGRLLALDAAGLNDRTRKWIDLRHTIYWYRQLFAVTCTSGNAQRPNAKPQATFGYRLRFAEILQ
jgi:hypothetical protein